MNQSPPDAFVFQNVPWNLLEILQMRKSYIDLVEIKKAPRL
jgi:hypothetical protein